MSDKEARALGAGEFIRVGDEQYKISPISMDRLQEIQREAIQYYKKEYLRTYAEACEMLSNGKAEKLFADAVEKAARWDVDDLPKKRVFDVSGVPVSKKLRKRLEELFDELPDDEDSERKDRRIRSLLATALDSEQMKSSEVKELTGVAPLSVQTPYDSWWVTSTYDGMISLIWSSLCKENPGISREEVQEWPLSAIIEVSRQVEKLTAPAVGNT